MRKWIRRSFWGLGAAFLALVAFIAIEMQTGNFHEIVPGEFYRSAQPSGKDLERYVKDYGIKTVINLRGGNKSDDWYREEVATSARLGINLIDFRMKAAHELTDEQALALIKLMKHAPKPLLIHCRAGADRSGLAAALYMASVKKSAESDAENQLSLRYGHLPAFPFWWTDAQAMRRTLERVEPLLEYEGS